MMPHFSTARRALLCLWMGFGLLAGGTPSTAAENDRTLAIALRDAVTEQSAIDMIDAMEALNAMSDPAVVQEFAIVNTLVDTAANENELGAVRAAALQALGSLCRRGIDATTILSALSKLIENEDSPQLIRLRTLRLLGMLAGDLEDGPIYRQAFSTLKSVWENRRRSRLPQALQKDLLAAAGGFWKVGEPVREMLLDGLDTPEATIRAGALQGLETYIRGSGEKSEKLLKSIMRMLRDSDDRPPAERAALLRCVTALWHHGARPDADDVRPVLLQALAGEDDEEARAAMRLARYMPDAAIVRALLSGFSKGPKVYETETLLDFCKSLADCFRFLRDQEEIPAAAEMAEAIATGFLRMIAEPDIPPSIKLSAARGLGCMPIRFDRRRVAAGLAQELKRQTDSILLERIESSLVLLTGATAKRTFRQGESVPDPDKWLEWIAAHAERLKAGMPPVVENER